MDIIIALDIGTSKIAAVAFDVAKQANIGVVSAVNDATVPDLPTGSHEQDPQRINDVCTDLLRKLVASGDFPSDDVKGVAFSGQMHGVLLVGPGLQPRTNLITWCDQRAANLTAAIDRTSWPADRTGCFLHPGYGGATVAALAAAGAIGDDTVALTIADYVAAKLTGVIATEPTHAASWGIMDVHTRQWYSDIIAQLGIPEKVLPEIRPAMSVLGPLTADLGLPADTVVCSPLGDNQASYIGTCGINDEELLLNLGTGGQVSIPCQDFSFVPELETRPLPFGGYLLVGASLCGGRSYAILKDFYADVIRKFTGQELSDVELYQTMDQLAEGADCSVEVDTRFAGTRLAPETRGQISGIGVDNFTPDCLSLGVIQGMVKELTDMVPVEARSQFDSVLASGNAIRKSPLAQRIITEELGIPCELTNNSEEAATGAALAAAKALKLG